IYKRLKKMLKQVQHDEKQVQPNDAGYPVSLFTFQKVADKFIYFFGFFPLDKMPGMRQDMKGSVLELGCSLFCQFAGAYWMQRFGRNERILFSEDYQCRLPD